MTYEHKEYASEQRSFYKFGPFGNDGGGLSPQEWNDLIKAGINCGTGVVGTITAFALGAETVGMARGLKFGETTRLLVDRVVDEVDHIIDQFKRDGK